MFMLDLDKPEEAEIKLSTSIGSKKKQKNSRKISTFASLTMLNPLTVDHKKKKKTWKILQEMGLSDHLTILM